jgi:DnaJ like chaperone protein
MGFLGSLFGAGIGWWMFGPIGAIMGLILGHAVEDKAGFEGQGGGKQNHRQSRDGFIASLLVLMAAVMKADGKVVKSELDYVKESLVRTFGTEKASEALLVLRNILKQSIPLQDVVNQIRINMDYSSRLELIHLLFGIGKADGELSTAEIHLIQQIAQGLGISQNDFMSMSYMKKDDIEAAYKILEIDRSVTNEEVKKAYRKMALRFHPDRVSHLGEDIQKSAHEKFQKLNQAYERIKKERSMK